MIKMKLLNNQNKRIVLIGNGGHASVITEIIHNFKLKISVVVDPITSSEKIKNCQYLKNDKSFISEFSNDDFVIVNGLGFMPGKKINKRKEIFLKYKKNNFEFPIIVHPSSIVSNSTIISEGVQIMAGVVIQSNVKVGENTLINTGALIDHHTTIGKNCHIAPGTNICGNVKIGNNVFIGVGSSILQGKKIGDNRIIPAGSVIK